MGRWGDGDRVGFCRKRGVGGLSRASDGPGKRQCRAGFNSLLQNLSISEFLPNFAIILAGVRLSWPISGWLVCTMPRIGNDPIPTRYDKNSGTLNTIFYHYPYSPHTR
jgi:hypothetical protein